MSPILASDALGRTRRADEATAGCRAECRCSRNADDGERFDAVDSAALDGASRRALLRRTLAAIFVDPLDRLVPTDDARAVGCRRAGARCRENRDCCRGARCRQRRCLCKGPRFADCDGDGRCEDLLIAHDHCGACDRVCSATFICFHGNCCRGPADFCACNPPGNACDARTCCQQGDCLPSGVCPGEA
jgi:hypothetical protein